MRHIATIALLLFSHFKSFMNVDATKVTTTSSTGYTSATLKASTQTSIGSSLGTSLSPPMSTPSASINTIVLSSATVYNAKTIFKTTGTNSIPTTLSSIINTTIIHSSTKSTISATISKPTHTTTTNSSTTTNNTDPKAVYTMTTNSTEASTTDPTTTAINTKTANSTGASTTNPTSKAAKTPTTNSTGASTTIPTSTANNTKTSNSIYASTTIPTLTSTNTKISNSIDASTTIPTSTATNIKTSYSINGSTTIPTSTATNTKTSNSIDASTTIPTLTSTNTKTSNSIDASTTIPTLTSTNTKTSNSIDAGTTIPTSTATNTKTSNSIDVSTTIPTLTSTNTKTSNSIDASTTIPTLTSTNTKTSNSIDASTTIPTLTSTNTKTSNSIDAGTTIPTSTATNTKTSNTIDASTTIPTLSSTNIKTSNSIDARTTTPALTAINTKTSNSIDASTSIPTLSSTNTKTSNSIDASTTTPTLTAINTKTSNTIDASTSIPTLTSTNTKASNSIDASTSIPTLTSNNTKTSNSIDASTTIPTLSSTNTKTSNSIDASTTIPTLTAINIKTSNSIDASTSIPILSSTNTKTSNSIDASTTTPTLTAINTKTSNSIDASTTIPTSTATNTMTMNSNDASTTISTSPATNTTTTNSTAASTTIPTSTAIITKTTNRTDASTTIPTSAAINTKTTNRAYASTTIQTSTATNTKTPNSTEASTTVPTTTNTMTTNSTTETNTVPTITANTTMTTNRTTQTTTVPTTTTHTTITNSNKATTRVPTSTTNTMTMNSTSVMNTIPATKTNTTTTHRTKAATAVPKTTRTNTTTAISTTVTTTVHTATYTTTTNNSTTATILTTVSPPTTADTTTNSTYPPTDASIFTCWNIQDDNITSNSIVFKDGLPATVHCSFWNLNINDSVQFEWNLNGHIISFISPHSRITTRQTKYYDRHGFNFNISLNFNPIYTRDKGDLRFTAVLNGKLESVIGFLDVIPQPTVIVFPLSKSIEENTHANLTCNMTYLRRNSSNSFRVNWTADGNQIPETYSTHGLNWTLSVLTVREKGNYTCTPYLGCASCSKYAIVDVYKREIRPCKSEEVDDISWGIAAPGSIQIQQCQEGYTGNIWRECDKLENGSGRWKNVNFINCTNEQIHNVLQDLDDIDTKNVSEVIGNALEIIKNVNEESHKLKSGDLDKSVDILDKVINIGNTSNQTIDAEDFGDIIDNMISSKNEKHWKEVNAESKTGGASRLLKTVSDFGGVLGKSLRPGQSKNITLENMELKVEKSKRTEISFTPKSTNDAKLVFPEENFPTSQKDFVFTTAFYKTIGSILPTSSKKDSATRKDIVSSVLALTIEGFQDHRKLNSPISLSFSTKQNNLTNPEVQCVYWDFNKTGWNQEGCSVVKSSSSSDVATCSCTHLTNFAILMSPSNVSEADKKRLQIISIIGCSFSILGLVLTVIVYIRVWRHIKNERSIILMNLCAALSIAYVFFLAAVQRTENEIPCIIITACLHYIFLVVFFLMLAEGIDIFIAVVFVFRTKKKFKWLLCMAWGIPLVIVGITIGVTRTRNYHSSKYCWLAIDEGVLFAFVGPVLLIILINIIVTIVVLRAVFSTHKMKSRKVKEKATSGVRSICTLLPVLGLTWVFGVLAINDDAIIFQYLFAIMNSLQGFFIFIFHCVLSRPVQNAMRLIIKRHDMYKSGTKESSLLPRRSSDVNNSDRKISISESQDNFTNVHYQQNREMHPYQIPRISSRRSISSSSLSV